MSNAPSNSLAIADRTRLTRVVLAQATSTAQWRADLLDLGAPSCGDPPEEAYLDECAKIAKQHVAPETWALIEAMHTPDGPHAVVLQSPLDPHVPDPPQNSKRPESKTYVTEGALWGCAQASDSEVVAFDPVLYGSTSVHEVAPAGAHATQPTGASRQILTHHNDHADKKPEFQPDVLWLTALLNDGSVPTRVTSASEVLASVPTWAIETATRPLFRQIVAEADVGVQMKAPPRPILDWTESGPHLFISPNGVESLEEQAEAALSCILASASRAKGVDVLLQPTSDVETSILCLNNKRSLHGRGTIASNDRRWLQRLYSMRSVEALRSVTGTSCGRIFDLRRGVLIPY